MTARSDTNAQKHNGISAFIIEKGTPGFTYGKKEDKMGIRSSSTYELIFEDFRIPAANLLGKEGEGYRIAMRILDGGRNGIDSQALGIAQGAFEFALDYTKTRVQFSKPIFANQSLQFMLADMATKIEAERLLTYQAIWLEGAGEPYGKANREQWQSCMPVTSQWKLPPMLSNFWEDTAM